MTLSEGPPAGQSAADANDSVMPRWMHELERLSVYKTQIYLYDNIKDSVFYPYGLDQREWTLGPLRSALFDFYRYRIGGYQIVASYNVLDGMLFADSQDENKMGAAYDDLIKNSDKSMVKASNRAPLPLKSDDPVYHALNQLYACLTNTVVPCVFFVEFSSQLLTGPTHIPACERMSFLRLLKASGDGQTVRVPTEAEIAASGVPFPGRRPARPTVQNQIVLICDKLNDLPTWLYLNNPFAASVAIDAPRTYERSHFFSRYLSKATGGTSFDVPQLVDLTEGMTFRDLMAIRTLARRPDAAGIKTKSLVDLYKYGRRDSEWDRLDLKRLENAEEILSRRVLGQPAAVSAVADMLRRARLDLSGAQHSSRSKPRGVLFFAGPTGVGKTELAKAVAELVFSSEEACIRFDMSEFAQAQTDQRLLGAPPGYVGYEEGGQLTNRVKSNPFCVLLFDEIEKAHPSILDKFLQILEDGRMTDGRGETVYFSESIIIFTSNAGIYQLDPQTGRPQVDPISGKPLLNVDPTEHTEYAEVQKRVSEGVQSYFKYILGRPELLNRIGQNIVVFDFVRPAIMRGILEKKVLTLLRAQIRERWKVEVRIADRVVDQLMELAGGDVASGGRGIGNFVEAALLNPIARVLFSRIAAAGPLAGYTLHVRELIPPPASGGHRYDIASEFTETGRESPAVAPAG